MVIMRQQSIISVSCNILLCKLNEKPYSIPNHFRSFMPTNLLLFTYTSDSVIVSENSCCRKEKIFTFQLQVTSLTSKNRVNVNISTNSIILVKISHEFQCALGQKYFLCDFNKA